MLSYWEREYFFKQPEICIIGSGIVGLTTALFVKQKYPDYEVFVLERGFLPDGASTKNAGFCCFGSVSELADDLKKSPREQVLSLAEKRFRGLQLLQSIVGPGNMDYEPLGGYEIFTTQPEFDECYGQAMEFNRDFKTLIGDSVYTNAGDKVSAFGFSGVAGMIKNNYEGQVDTGKMMKSLMARVTQAGVKLFYGMEVSSFNDTGTNVEVHTKNEFAFTCRKLVVTTNGFAKQLLPELDVQPARAQVLVTQPLDNLPFKGSFHYQQGYYYFRNVGNRVLLGGGRNLDFAAENTYEKGLTPLVQDSLDELLRSTILPGISFEVDCRWSGIMGVGNEKRTIVANVSPNVFCGVRMGGMGVALGSLVGKELGEMI